MKKFENWFELPLEERQKILEELMFEIVSTVRFSDNINWEEEDKLDRKIETLYRLGGYYEDMKKYLLQWKDICEGGGIK